jgi:hypothetical protein
MTLSIDGLKTAMMNATNKKTNGVEALTDMGNAIADYLKEEAVVSFSWTGTNTVSPYDNEKQTPEGDITSITISLTQSNKTSSSGALSHLADEITAGVKTAQYNITETGYTTTPAVMSDVTSLSLSIDGTSDFNSAYQQLAQQIYNWITGYVPAAPCAGSRLTYSGKGTPSGIS